MDDQYTNKDARYFVGNRNDVIPFIPQNAKTLLDVGCGSGGFGRLIKSNRDITIYGVEPTDAAKIAEKHLDHVLNSFFDQSTDLPDKHFDVITFNDSLEHFPYFEPPLDLAHQKLKEDGLLICSIPNVRYIENIKHLIIEKDWKYTDQGILDNTHLRFFTKKSMVRSIEKAGYKVINVQGINPHHWSTWKIKLLNLFFGKHIEDMKYLQFLVIATPIQK